MKALVIYEIAEGVTMDSIMAVYPQHSARVDEFTNAGKVIGIGMYADPVEGSMGIFRTKEDADNFVKKDPFVLAGIVGK